MPASTLKHVQSSIRHTLRCTLALLLAVVIAGCAALPAGPAANNGLTFTSAYYGIRFVDAETRRGIPLVQLHTKHGLRYVSDSGGWIAIHPDDVALQTVYYRVTSDGYSLPGMDAQLQGFRTTVKAGEGRQIPLQRHNLAERLYRVTGEGIYHDSQLLGQPIPEGVPTTTAGGVFGQDSVMNAIYNGQLHWFWGDTLRGDHPLGNFAVSGAVSTLPAAASIAPATGVALEYFVGADNFVRPMCPLDAPGPVWINCLLVFEEDEREHMFALYVRTSKTMERLEAGIARWNDELAIFEKQREIPVDAPMLAYGHPIARQVGKDPWRYYGYVMPYIRVPARQAAVLDTDSYEIYSCLKPGHAWNEKSPALDRDASGQLNCNWKANTSPIEPQQWEQLIASGFVRADEYRGRLVSKDTNEVIVPHRGTVVWNDYRQRWVMIAVQVGGSSYLGEVWYAESPSPFGPWNNVTKIATHDDYTFYNVKQHPYFAHGPYIYFEGTYTRTYSGRRQPTPRYDYNQIMYRIDLSNPALVGLSTTTAADGKPHRR